MSLPMPKMIADAVSEVLETTVRFLTTDMF